jgi:hypothetical protein
LVKCRNGRSQCQLLDRDKCGYSRLIDVCHSSFLEIIKEKDLMANSKLAQEMRKNVINIDFNSATKNEFSQAYDSGNLNINILNPLLDELRNAHTYLSNTVNWESQPAFDRYKLGDIFGKSHKKGGMKNSVMKKMEIYRKILYEIVKKIGENKEPDITIRKYLTVGPTDMDAVKKQIKENDPSFSVGLQGMNKSASKDEVVEYYWRVKNLIVDLAKGISQIRQKSYFDRELKNALDAKFITEDEAKLFENKENVGN